jgi:hypothetical protein
MKIHFLVVIMFLALIAQPELSQQANPPLTKDQVTDLVKFGLDGAELAKRINERGVGFEPSGQYLEYLRNAGAKDVVIQALVARSAFAQESGVPLTKEQVTILVTFLKDGIRVANGIKERGIDFDPTDDYLEGLREAGVEAVVIKALLEANPKPLTREQVGKLVAGRLPSQRAAALVRQHGVDFQPDAPYLDTLRLAGADDTLIAELRAASAAGMGELMITTSPNAEMYLDSALQGKADAQGVFSIKAFRGRHTLRVSLEGKKDFEQSVMFVGRQATTMEVWLTDIKAELFVGTSPGADVYLDGTLQGRTDYLGELSFQATFGTHSLRISKSGRTDFLSSVRVNSQETIVINAILP